MVKRTTLSDVSESDIIHAAASGDQQAFTELVRRYEKTIFRFSLKLCRDKGKAEETLQDTFINVFRKLRSFDGRSKFTTWLYTIVTNNCLMRHRKRKMETLEESLEVLDSPPVDEKGRFIHPILRWEETPADIVLTKEMRRHLDEAIDKLPPLYRVVFVLRDVEGKSTEEAGAILKISSEAVKSRLRRARAFLREQLNPYFSGAH